MTLTVYKSQLAGVDFAEVVEEYRQALLAHRFTGDMAPHAHSLIEAAVRRVPQGEGKPDDFVADFEIIDDTPAPPTDAERKQVLVARLRLAEASALDGVIGGGKLRLLSLNASEAGIKPEADRTPDEVLTLATLQSVLTRRSAINRHSATVEAAIDDLAPADYDAFQIPAFPQ